jgi:hypothetical protein
MPRTDDGGLEYMRMEYERLSEDLRSLNNLWLALFGFFITVNTLLVAAVAFSYDGEAAAGEWIRTATRLAAAVMGLFMSIAAAITVSSLASNHLAIIERGCALENACGARLAPTEPPPAFAGLKSRVRRRPILTWVGAGLFAIMWLAVLAVAPIHAPSTDQPQGGQHAPEQRSLEQ